MAESPRSVSAAPLEIPVTIQGSRTVEGSDQRELFVESTKTTLVFDSGAVLSLKAKVSPGQCVFLRNEESGKEILCKVLESRQQGDSNYADLEFTVYEPDFWNGHSEGEEFAEQKSEAQKKVEAAVATLTAEPKSEPAKPVTEESHSPAPEAESPVQGEPPSHMEEASAVETAAPKEHEPAATEKSPVEAKPEATGGESHEAEAELAAMDPAEAIADPTEAEVGLEPEPQKAKKQKPARPPNFKARKIAAAVSVTAAVLVISFQVYTWRGRIFHLKNKISNSAAKLSKRPNENAASIATVGATTPAASTTESAVKPATTAASANRAPGATGASGETSASSTPAAVNVKTPAISTKALASPEPRPEVVKSAGSRQPVASKAAKRSKSNPVAETAMVPAVIVSQPQPSMPPWARKMDLDGTVQLDAVIDENGNIAQSTPISGPPILQHAAQQAVALWIFQPATRDGQPVSSHMVLTVEFQR